MKDRVIRMEKDRRIFDRFEVDFPTVVKEPKSEQSRSAQCCDVSAGGLGLITEEKLSMDKNLEISLGIPDGHAPFRGTGKVIWSEQVQENKWHSGFEFKTIDFMGLRRIFATLPQGA